MVEHNVIPGGELFIPQVPKGIVASRLFHKKADPKVEGYAKAILEDMDREDPENAVKLRNFLNRNVKGPKVKNLFASRSTDPAFVSHIRKQPPANIVRRVVADNLPATMGPFYNFSTNLALDRQMALKRVRTPIDFLPLSARIQVLVDHGYPLDTPKTNPDLWMRIVCVYLFKYVERLAHERGFYNWVEKYAWFKSSTVKQISYRYFDPVKADLNLSHAVNAYLHPFEREFLHLVMDFLTRAFFFMPGTDTFDAFCMALRLLDESYIDKKRIDNIIWKRVTGEFGSVGEFPPVEKPDQLPTPPPSTPSTSRSSSSLSFHEYWSTEDDYESPDSY